MKKLIIALLFSCSIFNCFAKGTDFELRGVPLPEAIGLLYGEVFKQPFMLAPELINDERKVYFHITPDIDERAFINRYFSNMNIRIWPKNGVDYITPFTPKTPEIKRESFVYQPRFRSVGYLSDILRGQFEGRFNQQGGIGSYSTTQLTDAQPNSATDFINRHGDVLVYYGTKNEIERMKTILPLIDTATEEVIVSAYVFEVQTAERNGSGLALAAKLVSGKFNVGIGSESGFDNFVRFKTGSLDALYELFRTDSRFHVVSSPRLRVSNGAKAAFSVGSDVPVLGQVSYSDNKPVQSIEYRSSGIILSVQPEIRQDLIELNIDQQISNFAKTETGVNNSPTLIKRQVNTQVSVADGDIILLGGLAENKVSEAETGFSFLPKDWFTGSSDEHSKTDILVMLQVKKVSR